MNLNSIGSVATSSVPTDLQTPATQGTPRMHHRRHDGDGDAGGGGLMGGILQALAASGVLRGSDASGANADGATSGTGAGSATTRSVSDVASALKDFVGSLMDALRAQSSGGATGAVPTTGGDPDGDEPGGDGVRGTRGAGFGGPGRFASDLNSLIQQLAAGGTTTTGNSGTSSGTTTSGSGDALANLQASFDALATALGGTGGSSSLSAFLQSFAQTVPQVPTRGNQLNAQA
jgi:hypothetical protein